MGNPYWNWVEPSASPVAAPDLIASMEALWREVANTPAPDIILCSNHFLDVLLNAREVHHWRGRKFVTRPFVRLLKREKLNG